MNSPIGFTDNPQTALVIMFPPGVTGLFNPDVHGLVRNVQEQLQGVYVTYALSSGSAPTLRDAIAAASFAGCRSSVVVNAGDGGDSWLVDAGSDGDWLLASLPEPAELDVTGVVTAFKSALVDSGRAA